jgi:Helicase conserved C-terminal domain
VSSSWRNAALQGRYDVNPLALLSCAPPSNTAPMLTPCLPVPVRSKSPALPRLMRHVWNALSHCVIVFQAARKINIAKFRAGRAQFLVVTDVAARGIDIPLLDNVINYDFPPQPKLFVHRVGRAARSAGALHACMRPV